MHLYWQFYCFNVILLNKTSVDESVNVEIQKMSSRCSTLWNSKFSSREEYSKMYDVFMGISPHRFLKQLVNLLWFLSFSECCYTAMPVLSFSTTNDLKIFWMHISFDDRAEIYSKSVTIYSQRIQLFSICSVIVHCILINFLFEPVRSTRALTLDSML